MSTDTPTLAGQYPQSWSEYVGQEDAKKVLRRTAHSSAALKETLPHLLICSPMPGVGKTALGLLTVRTANRPVHMVSGQMKLSDAISMFADLQDDDIVFYDEFHTVGKASWLLNYLENGVLLTPYGLEVVPRVTFVAATTDKGVILPTILDRFKVIDLEPYTDEEGALIAAAMSQKVLVPAGLAPLSAEVAAAIAVAAFNQPRRMRDLLFTIRDLVICEEIPSPEDGSYVIEEALRSAGLSPDGLTKDARAYLVLLRRDMNNQPCGEALLKSRLRLVGKGLESVELLLLAKGYIATTKAGRMLTSAGTKRANELIKEMP